MGQVDTSMGGSREAFPETAWSSILSRADSGSPERRARVDELIRRYWRPIYKFIRAGSNRSVEDAKDLTQEFFCRMLDGGGVLAGYEPAQGRFRSYLKGALKFFLAAVHRDGRVLKRGGGRAVVSLDLEGVETQRFLEERASATPEEIFDRQWAKELLAESIARLEKALPPLKFRAFEAYSLAKGPGPSPTYEEVARRLGITASDVKNHLVEARAKLDELLVESVSGSVTTREELVRELAELFSG